MLFSTILIANIKEAQFKEIFCWSDVNFSKHHYGKSRTLQLSITVIAFVGFFIGEFAGYIFPLFDVPFFVIWIGMMIPFLRWKVFFYHFVFTLPSVIEKMYGGLFLGNATPILVSSIIVAYALSYSWALAVYVKMKKNHVFDWMEVLN